MELQGNSAQEIVRPFTNLCLISDYSNNEVVMGHCSVVRMLVRAKDHQQPTNTN